MRTVTKLLVTAICLLGAVSPLLAADTSTAALKAVFEERYAAMKAAVADRDPEAIAALLTSDFVSEDVDGKTETKEQMTQQVTALPKDPNKQSETIVLDVHQVDDTATVTQQYHMTTVRARAAGDPQHIDMVATSTDTWIKSQGTWLLQRTVTNELVYTVDGKPVLNKKRGTPPTQTGS